MSDLLLSAVDVLLLPALPERQLIVTGEIVEVRQHRLRRRLHHRHLRVRAGELADHRQRLPHRHRQELHPRRRLPLQQISPLMPGDPLELRENLPRPAVK